MKKKITALCLCVALLAIAVVGASLAYFTDTDDATNEFTVGKVDISLKETFDKDNANLIPGSTTKNNIEKKVWIELDSKSEDAWVWYEWLIPTVLDDVDNATYNVVHVNSAGSTWDKYREDSDYWPDGQTEALPLEQTWDPSTIGMVGTETIDGIQYNKYVRLYHGKLSNAEGGQTKTTVGMTQVYMDEHVDTNEKGEYTINGKVINYDFTKGVKIIVRAYAIQADGFDDVYAAYAAYQKQNS